jgi:hypothetical protein
MWRPVGAYIGRATVNPVVARLEARLRGVVADQAAGGS